ncbi:MAG: hypothetical protein JWO33_731 [Caulobacteraceae bacterium]|nr:hypothetical protein [Caulobacteraceae bacterium]
MAADNVACRVCDAVHGVTPGGVLLEHPLWHVAHMAPGALIRGAVLIRARRHVESFGALTPEELTSLGPIQGLLDRALTQALSAAKVYFVAFGEGAPHVHVLALPRYADMPAGDGVATLGDVMTDRKYAIAPAAAEDTAAILRTAIRGMIEVRPERASG